MRVTKTAIVSLQWNTFTLPILPGTPVSIAGAKADNENAIGIIMQGIPEVYEDDDQVVMIGGSVDYSELGYELSMDAMRAMPGIDFYMADKRPYRDTVSNDWGTENAGAFLVVDEDGTVTVRDMDTWQAGSY